MLASRWRTERIPAITVDFRQCDGHAPAKDHKPARLDRPEHRSEARGAENRPARVCTHRPAHQHTSLRLTVEKPLTPPDPIDERGRPRLARRRRDADPVRHLGELSIAIRLIRGNEIRRPVAGIPILEVEISHKARPRKIARNAVGRGKLQLSCLTSATMTCIDQIGRQTRRISLTTGGHRDDADVTTAQQYTY